ncbi:cyclic nucleotide-binding domain-containing protein 2-like isoform X2 [Acipenser ruthenus]|uniref:cyclic nucleotide-binding domain-containing protein 2-like isoform X2 n=1 Tax=Acipenser ruthenus TaxID=7906 RepID=UPI0027422461|nr:cyclic nucleotide-binding domain-containing protein 2-like isoform X2 [Acipenser ruthenus]
MDLIKLKDKRDYREFLRLARIVKTICGINLALKRHSGLSMVKQWAETNQRTRPDLARDLLFNIDIFTRNKLSGGCAKLKNLLSISPLQRRHHDVQKIQALLRKNRAFESFPDSIQHQICQVAVYQKYEATRTVLKQGHPSQDCYFVLAGSLLVKVNDISRKGNSTTQTLNEVEEGDMFGEACLLTCSIRHATVVCKTDVELLLIDKEDFNYILEDFLRLRYSVISNLIRKLPLFSSWSADKLELVAKGSMLRHYRSGALVVPNILISSFIVVVKSGRCQLVTHLRMPGGRAAGSCDTLRIKSLSSLLQDFPTLSFIENKMTHIKEALQRPSTSNCIFSSDHERDMNNKLQKKKRPMTAVTPSRPSANLRGFCEREHAGNTEGHLETQKEKPCKTLSAMKSTSSPALLLRIGIFDQGSILVSPEVVGRECDLNMSLISEGTECIFIPKGLFLKEAPSESVQAALELVNTYPTESIIRENYVRYQAWSAYKDKLVRQRCKRQQDANLYPQNF